MYTCASRVQSAIASLTPAPAPTIPSLFCSNALENCRSSPLKPATAAASLVLLTVQLVACSDDPGSDTYSPAIDRASVQYVNSPVLS